MVLLTDNESHFAANAVTTWLSDIRCRHLFTASGHPCYNGQAENFVRILETAINFIAASLFDESDGGVDTFLLQHRNAKHSVTKETRSKLLNGRIPRPNVRRLESSGVTCYRGNGVRPAIRIVVKIVRKSMVEILDINDLSTLNRHVDQLQLQEPSESVPIPAVDSNINKYILDHADSTIDYRNSHSHLSCGGCVICTNQWFLLTWVAADYEFQV